MTIRRTSGNIRKRGHSTSRHHLLELNVRTASLKRQRRERATGVLWKILAFLLVVALLAIGGRLAVGKFFLRNSEYELHHLECHLGGVMTREELVALTGFEEGKNLFLLDLDLAHRNLAALPEVRTASVERIVPDTIRVNLERRIPVLLFAGTGDAGESFLPGKSFLCDRDGILMQPSRLDPEFLDLPILRGVDPGTTPPGSALESDRLAFALQLQAALSQISEDDFNIRSIDVSKDYAAVVTDGSQEHFTFGREDLPGQIDRLKKLLAHCRESGRKIESANLMVVRNTPVTFALTPELAIPKITPVPVVKKHVRR